MEVSRGHKSSLREYSRGRLRGPSGGPQGLQWESQADVVGTSGDTVEISEDALSALRGYSEGLRSNFLSDCCF